MIIHKQCECCESWYQEIIQCDFCGLEKKHTEDGFFDYIEVYYPYTNSLDNMDEPNQFCSNQCLINYTKTAL
jgi:hypothetical protein